MIVQEFTELPDLASRLLGGSVIAANDEAFADRENLINPWPPQFSEASYGHKGKVYDGWETRRRREPGNDWAIVRLGVAGIIRGVVIDTAWFKGNFPPAASLQATSIEGYPSPQALADAHWHEIVAPAELVGDIENRFVVASDRRYTHVRLNIYPDGGVARLRVHGEVVPDPRFLPSSLDFAALENGGLIADCSDSFYTSPTNLVMPGRARTTGEGWENARRRGDGNDFVHFRLATAVQLRLAELDTSCFVYNAPDAGRLQGLDVRTGQWVELLPRTALRPDTRQTFRLAPGPAVTDVRMDVYPDGGLARVRLIGDIDESVRASLLVRWFNALPGAHAELVLRDAGASGEQAAELVAARPLQRPVPLLDAMV